MSSLINIISALNSKEKKEFEIFLDSPLFSRRKKLKPLYKELIKNHLTEGDPEIDKIYLYKKLFKKEFKLSGYNDATIRHLLFELQGSLDKFLVIKSIDYNKLEFEKLRRREYRNRKLDSVYIKALNESGKIIAQNSKIGSDNFLATYELLLEKKNYESMFSDFIIKRNKKVGIEEIDEIAKYLTYYFILELLYLNDGAEKYAMRFNQDYENSFLFKLCEKIDVNEFVKFLAHEAGDEKEGKVFKVYEKFFELFKVSDEKEYKALKDYVLKNVDMLDTNTRSHIFFQFVKYCSINPMGLNAEKEFSSELFNILKIMVDNGYYEHTEGPYFQVDLYRILFLMGCDEGEIEWTENFVKKFAGMLPQEFRKTAFHCGMAHVLFNKSDYDSAHNELNKMDEEYFNLEVDKKILLIRIFYETEAYDQAVSLINSMQRYIDESNKVSFTLKEKINNFMRFTLRLIKATERSDKHDLSDLTYEIMKEPQVRAKKWLVEKAQ